MSPVELVVDRPHLLIMDDEPDLAEFLAAVAEGVGYRCTVITDPMRFQDALHGDVALIMLDLVMPGLDGIELLRALSRAHHPAGVILMSGFDRRVLASARELAKELGLHVRGQLEKPIRAADLEAFLRAVPRTTTPPSARPPQGPPVTEAELATAIRDQQLEMHYQPQIDLVTRGFVGVEALVRWRHPMRGLVYPGDFIGLAEQTGQIDALTWLAYERAAAEFRVLNDAHGPLQLSLNLSACSLHDLETPEKLADIAHRWGLAPSSLILEITETGLMHRLASALDVLTRLRMRGMELSIDDFGTGYSMMEQLRRVPASEIKIDRSFVNDATHDEGALVMVEKTIEIGRRLQMRVVGEGVETSEQSGMLRALGCDAVQGYLFSRPLPMPALVSWVMAWRAASAA